MNVAFSHQSKFQKTKEQKTTHFLYKFNNNLLKCAFSSKDKVDQLFKTPLECPRSTILKSRSFQKTILPCMPSCVHNTLAVEIFW